MGPILDALDPTAAVRVTADLDVYPRAVWAGSDHPPTGPLEPEDVRFLLVHHTAGSNELAESAVLTELQSVYRFHTGPAKGWPDVCYNFFIDPFGRVFEGRQGSLEGTVRADATGGNQGFAELVCLLGNFTDQQPSQAAMSALVSVLAWRSDRHKIPIGTNEEITFVSRGSNRWPEGASVTTNTIAGHRDMSATECPGDAFYPTVRDELPALVASARATLATSPPAPAPTTTPSATTTEPATATTPAAPTSTDADPTVVPVGAPSSLGDLASLGDLVSVNTVGGVAAIATVGALGWVIARRRTIARQAGHRSERRDH